MSTRRRQLQQRRCIAAFTTPHDARRRRPTALADETTVAQTMAVQRCILTASSRSARFFATPMRPDNFFLANQFCGLLCWRSSRCPSPPSFLLSSLD